MPPGAGGVYTAPTMTRRRLPDPRRSLPCRWALLLVGLSLAGVFRAGADDGLLPVGEGEPFVRYFTAHDYQGASGCQGMTQDARGVMYLGNFDAILEYDGATWRHLPKQPTGYIGALAYDAGTDTVFVGAQSDLGYLARCAPGGAHTFVSLRDQLPADAREAGRFLAVYATPQGVYFVGSDRVLRWRDGRFQTWKLATKTPPFSYWAAGRLYVASVSLGLQRLEGDAFVPASDDPIFHKSNVVALVAEPDGSLLLSVYDHGFCRLRDGVLTPAHERVRRVFQAERRPGGMIRLRDGSLAVGTPTGGVVILDAARRFRSHLDKTAGLLSDYTAGLFEDAEGGLWIGQLTGVARAEPDSPLSLFRGTGPAGHVDGSFTNAHWRGTMAFGNTGGILHLAPADPATATGPRLESLVGGITASNALCTVANGVLAVNSGDVLLLDNERKLFPYVPGTGFGHRRGGLPGPSRPGLLRHAGGAPRHPAPRRGDGALGRGRDGGGPGRRGQAEDVGVARGRSLGGDGRARLVPGAVRAGGRGDGDGFLRPARAAARGGFRVSVSRGRAARAGHAPGVVPVRRGIADHRAADGVRPAFRQRCQPTSATT